MFRQIYFNYLRTCKAWALRLNCHNCLPMPGCFVPRGKPRELGAKLTSSAVYLIKARWRAGRPGGLWAGLPVLVQKGLTGFKHPTYWEKDHLSWGATECTRASLWFSHRLWYKKKRIRNYYLLDPLEENKIKKNHICPHKAWCWACGIKLRYLSKFTSCPTAGIGTWCSGSMALEAKLSCTRGFLLTCRLWGFKHLNPCEAPGFS